jgi:hypothetical protein
MVNTASKKIADQQPIAPVARLPDNRTKLTFSPLSWSNMYFLVKATILITQHPSEETSAQDVHHLVEADDATEAATKFDTFYNSKSVAGVVTFVYQDLVVMETIQ